MGSGAGSQWTFGQITPKTLKLVTAIGHQFYSWRVNETRACKALGKVVVVKIIVYKSERQATTLVPGPRGLVEHIVRGLPWEMRAAVAVMRQNLLMFGQPRVLELLLVAGVARGDMAMDKTGGRPYMCPRLVTVAAVFQFSEEGSV